MKRKTRKIIIAIIGFIGALLLLISSINFGFRIPHIQDELDSAYLVRELFMEETLLYQAYLRSTEIIENQYNMMLEINSSSLIISYLDQNLRDSFKSALWYLHARHKNDWSENITFDYSIDYSLPELTEMHKQMTAEIRDSIDKDISTQDRIMNDINSLTDEKDNIMIQSTIIQVIGFIIVQFDIFLSLFLLDEKRKS